MCITKVGTRQAGRGVYFVAGPEVVPVGGFAFEQGAEVAQRVRAGFWPAHAGAFEAAADDTVAG